MDPLTKFLIDAFEAKLAWQALPTVTKKTRDGWAAYKGDRRITRFVFSEEKARDLGIEWEASDVKVEFVQE